MAVTEQGVAKVEELLNIENLYDSSNTMLVHHLHNALRAKELYKRDVAYVVQNGEVKIVDEFTGRVLEGRRYSEGLHQAIEAKEGVRIKEENQTLATITIQNYFKMYDKLAGMTGTAKTQLTEFEETYKIGVVEIPTNAPNIRDDKQDLIYKSEDEKWDAVADDIIQRNERGQPILVGTVSIEKSERLSGVLNRRGIQHNVLNAKNHEKEAVIVAQAGRKGSVTVATNMAGRGVDILLGGNPEYLARQEMAAREWDNDRYLLFEMDEEERVAYETEYEPILAKFRAQTDAEHDEVVGLGGLYVQGTERHESRRIDNQLRGRSGRQGDPGESLFYLSLEDDLMRMFASDRVAAIMNRFKWPEGEPIEAKMVSRAVENAQKQIEELNYERRKNVLKYDEVMNGQRAVIYGERRKILEGHDLKEQALGFVEDVIADVVVSWCPPDTYPEDWDREALLVALGEYFPVRSTVTDIEDARDVTELQARFVQEAEDAYEAKEAGDHARDHAGARAGGAAQHHGHEMARAPVRDGLPPRRDPPAFVRPAGPPHRVPARGVHDVRRAHGVDPGGLREVHLPGRAGAAGSAAGAGGEPGPAHAGEPRRGRLRRRRRGRGSPGGWASGQPSTGVQRQGAAQRALPVRQRQEVQEVPRRRGVAAVTASGSTGQRDRPRPRCRAPQPTRTRWPDRSLASPRRARTRRARRASSRPTDGPAAPADGR